MLAVQERDVAVAVINDQIILKSVCEENPDPENADAVHENGTADFTELKVLSLSFKNVFKIDNLVTLNSLVSLKLDNNVIQRIEGIGHLTNLVWLDLSFNNISTIEGLENLVHLCDLTLFNNNISKLENLETLKKLQVFSIGNNQLISTDGLLYLRQIETLRVLNLEGNPVCSDPEYRPFVLAHLDKLKYLDYVLVDNTEAQLAKEQYQDELEEFKEKKMLVDAAKKREKDMDEQIRVLKEANVYIVETLFTDMFKEDTEIGKIAAIPGLQNIKDDYGDKVKSCIDNVKSALLEKHSSIMREKENFKKVYNKLQQSTDSRSIEEHEKYRRKVKKLFQSVRNASDTGSPVGDILSEARDLSQALKEELMSQESNVVDQCQELLEHFETSVEAVASEIAETTTEFFRSVEDLENSFYESVSQLAVQLIERIAAEDADDDDLLSEECRAILNNRDMLNSAINGSHDIHIGKLIAQEDLKREQGSKMISNMLKDMSEKEWTRNRTRVAEIIALHEKQQTEINDLKEEVTRVDDEFY